MHNDSSYSFPENSVLLSRVPSDKELQGFNRLYFGNEFCARLMPKYDEIEEALKIVSNKDIGFTFVTPFITDAKIEHLMNLLEILRDKKPESEIVVNDYGVLNLIKKYFSCFGLICGRLLFKKIIPSASLYQMTPLNKRYYNDIRLHRVLKFKNILKPMLSPQLLKYLYGLRIRRIEFNNIIDVIKFSEELREFGFKISLYFPFSYLACTRYCYYGSEKELNPRFSLLKCSQECENRFILLRKRNQKKEMILKWNTLFIKDAIDVNICRDKIDRLIGVTL